MHINIADGTVSFDAGSIGPHLGRSEFLRTPVGEGGKSTLVNDGWINVDIRPEASVIGTVLFENDRMNRIFLSLHMPSDDAGEWTVERELERKSKHDEWLRGELGKPPYRFAWGEIVSDFDPRGCASEIIISYASGSRPPATVVVDP